jgi:hypothetical protein
MRCQLLNRQTNPGKVAGLAEIAEALGEKG